MNFKHFPIFIAINVAVVCACNYSNFYIAERNWIMEEPFILECLTENPREDEAKLKRLMGRLKKKYPHVFFIPQVLHIRVDVQERKNRDKAPITRFMTSGHGVLGTLARFEKRLPTEKQFDRLFTSPVKRNIIKELKKKNLVLLIVYGSDVERNKALLRCAKKGKKMVKDILNKRCSILSVDLDSKRERFLLDNIFLQRQKRRAGIFILFGKGKGLHFLDDPKHDKIILDIAQMLDNNTNTESASLEARILLNMPLPW